MLMKKRTLDTLGGAASIVVGLACIGLAVLHDPNEKMFAVWLVTSVLLVANGILMLVHAHREGGLPGLAKDLVRSPHGKVIEHGAHR